MPTYEYQCAACDHRFDAFQKMTDEALKDCPNCHKDQLKRGPGGGSGFTITNNTRTENSASMSSGLEKSCGCGKKKGSCHG